MKKLLYLLLLFFPFLFPDVTYAHAFGQLYTLPIPVWLYIYGGGITLIVSFVIIGLFVNEKKSQITEKTIDISSSIFSKIITAKKFQKTTMALSLFVWAIVILAGFIGDQTPTNNLTPLFFWVIFLLGGIYSTAIIGNFWKIVSPVRTVYMVIAKWLNCPFFSYPEKFGYVPALILYYIVVWMELLSRGWAVVPHILSTIILGYFIFHVLMAVFLGEKWLKFGELFTVIFGFLGEISPIHFEDGKMKLRLPFIGLAQHVVQNKSMLLLILFMLSSTAFDGLRATIVWRPIQYAIFPFFGFVSHDPFVVFPLVQSIALFLSPFLFLLLYEIAIYCMKKIVRSKLSMTDLSLKFAFSLVPIALAYNIAHYFTLLFTGIQSVLTYIFDPFNRGWDFFHTLQFETHGKILRASTVWNIEVIAIVGGHIIAVYVAHKIALKIFPSHKKALVSQLPMLILMVLYTITGLWILSQPLTIGV